jgi:dimethylhistidine N-methyltransferase
MGALRTLQVALPEAANDVAQGLGGRPKSLPPRLFYDAIGSRLFERITRLPEYYLTRTESGILDTCAAEVLQRAESPAANLSLVELGAGTAAKTSTLIRALLRRQLQVEFYPIDVCESALQVARQSLMAISPRVKFHPLVADYTQGLGAAAHLPGRKLVLYLGSSIGNFEPEDAAALLRRLRCCLQGGDSLLLGVDLAKSPALLAPAYNDRAGVTARFNKNVLARINRELGGHFDLRAFRHVAEWNHTRSRMEMYLESRWPQAVAIDLLDMRVAFAAGERIHTENSYKYTPLMARSLFQDSGFELEQTWTDQRGWFALYLAKPAREPSSFVSSADRDDHRSGLANQRQANRQLTILGGNAS